MPLVGVEIGVAEVQSVEVLHVKFLLKFKLHQLVNLVNHEYACVVVLLAIANLQLVGDIAEGAEEVVLVVGLEEVPGLSLLQQV